MEPAVRQWASLVRERLLGCYVYGPFGLFLSLSAANACIITPFDPFTKVVQCARRFQDLRVLRVSSVLGVFAFNGVRLGASEMEGDFEKDPLFRKAGSCGTSCHAGVNIVFQKFTTLPSSPFLPV